MTLRAESRLDGSSRTTPIGYTTGIGALIAVGLLSALVSLLYLTGSLFMLEVYDRVLPSRSLPTLAGLGVLVLGLYVFQGFFDIIRGRLLVRIAIALDGVLRRKTYEAIVRAPLVGRIQGDGLQPLRDLDQVRAFLSSNGPAALFDLPWVPLYIGLCFAFHFWIGITALAGALLLIVLTITTDVLTRSPTRSAAQAASQSAALANASQQNAEVLRAMGMVRDMADAWEEACDGHVRGQHRIADITSGLGALTKVVRLALQSGVLTVGAYLVILGEATGGIMIASSILLSRALAPVELAIGNWKGFVAARQSWARLRCFLARFPDNTTSVTLPAPHTQPRRGEDQRRGAGMQSAAGSGNEFQRFGRRSPGGGRSVRFWKVIARPRSRRSLAAVERQRQAGRRLARTMGAGSAWRPYRLPATGCGTVSGHNRSEHCSLFNGRELGFGDRCRSRSWSPRTRLFNA